MGDTQDAAKNELTESDYRNAIEKLKGRDRVGLAGEVGVTAGAAVAGAASAAAIASSVGATTLLGSSTLASALGGVFVTTTPVGWVVGAAAVAGLAGYGVSKLIRSGARQDAVREGYIKSISKKIGVAHEGQSLAVIADERSELFESMGVLVATGKIEQEVADGIIRLVDSGKLDVALARRRVIELVEES